MEAHPEKTLYKDATRRRTGWLAESAAKLRRARVALGAIHNRIYIPGFVDA